MLCLAFWFTSYSNAQDLVPGQIYSTGNIVIPTTTSTGSTWTGAVYQDQLTCWRGGDPGYCGPNAIVRPGNYINFSYGSTYVYQQQHINAILPAGTGLQVTGYNFGFTAKNGNGWDNGMTDQLTALVRFWDSTGGKGVNNLLYGNSWNLSSKYNWTTFNYSENFQNPLTATNVGLVQYGFIGKDNNGWAGPYGPEVMNVNFSVKYSVDPCASNPMYAPTCPGYLDALTKLLPKSTNSDTQTAYTPPPPPPDGPEPPPGAPQPQSVAAQSSMPPAGNQPPPGAPPAQQAPQQTQTASTAAGSSQEKSSTGTPNLGFALSLIARNSDREKAVAQQVVASSIAEAQAAGDRAQQIGTATASAAVAASTGSSETSFSGTGIQISSSSSRSNTVVNVTAQQPISSLAQNQQAFASATNTQQSAMLQLLTPASIEQMQTTQNSSIFAVQEFRQQESETVTQQVSFLTDLNNPIKQILDAQQFQQQSQEQPQQTVKRDPAPNDLAVGVNLAQMATVPANYASYTNFVLRDAQFYEIREVYKNQTVVDNQRVLRGLGSDKKHQDLVNLQYK